MKHNVSFTNFVNYLSHRLNVNLLAKFPLLAHRNHSTAMNNLPLFYSSGSIVYVHNRNTLRCFVLDSWVPSVLSS